MTTPLIELTDAKAQLNMSQAVTTNDDELTMWLAATTDIIEHYVGDVVPTAYTEHHHGGGFTIATLHAPIISVQSITEYMGNVAYTLTEQPVGASTDPYGFSIDNPTAGIIARRTAASWPYRFLGGENNIAVTYTAGLTTIPTAVLAAARIILQHLWTTRRGAMPMPPGGGDGSSVVPGLGYAVPNQAIELLARFERTAGIA
jgi:hypothetical protein